LGEEAVNDRTKKSVFTTKQWHLITAFVLAVSAATRLAGQQQTITPKAKELNQAFDADASKALVGVGMKTIIRRLRRLEDRFGLAPETEFDRQLLARLEEGLRRVADAREHSKHGTDE